MISIDYNEFGLYKLDNTSILLKTENHPDGYAGWLIRSSQRQIGAYRIDWSTEFASSVTISDLSEKEIHLVTKLLTENKSVKALIKLGLPEPEIFTITGTVIDIHNNTMFSINDVLRLIYTPNSITFIFKNYQSQEWLISPEDLEAIKTLYTNKQVIKL